MRSPAARRSSTSGSRPQAMTVLAPLPAARLAASTLVIMPPRPMDEPAPPAISSSAGSPASASSMKRACGSLRGSAEYRPRWSVRITSASASTRLATSAPSVSLSPNLISSLTTVSFSLITGITLQRQQRQQGRARIQVALAVGQVGMRQQHLRAAQAVLAQLGLVHLHQTHLADRGGGLQLVQFLRPRCSSPGASCPRRWRRWTPSPARAPARPAPPAAGTSCRWPRHRRPGPRW